NDPNHPAPFTPAPGGTQFVSGLELATIGLPSSIFQTLTTVPGDPTLGLRFTEVSLFVNDTFRVSGRLTADFGVRYQRDSVPHDAHNIIEDAIQLKNVPAAGASEIDNRDRASAFNAAVEAYRRIVGGRHQIYEPGAGTFGPHAGLAWVVVSDRRRVFVTIARSGYGIYHDTILGAVVNQSRNVFPA